VHKAHLKDFKEAFKEESWTGAASIIHGIALGCRSESFMESVPAKKRKVLRNN